ncbi:Hypothetical protein CINCED_3A001085 [Cinara cedri]|uniref:Glutathione peroxidase n=1 Tax=Cinara cedri TaxID=506608 RepID=A0A5E4N9J5_9HEMI|nr:Hypothetical protein CINCED_3A001085 [Cinara cedri]
MEIQGCIIICFVATFLWQTSVISSTVDVENSMSTVVVENSKSTVGVENVQPDETLVNQMWSYVVNSQLVKSMFNKDDPTKCITSIYDITVKDLNGNDVCLGKYKGQVLLIVNYASKCLLTSENVDNLSKLALEYAPQGFKVLIFPSNTFYENIGGNNAGITLQKEHPEFDVFYQVDVNGANTDLLYVYLKKQLPGNSWISSNLWWNFVKFLVDKSGKPNQRFETYDSIESINEAVKKLLIQN